ncbi:MAG: phosphatidate cytidylyltransferase [Bacteroidetes bacterium]|nr:phosphatidate cytidylyltransferase [Bacteroidota bacterium]
MALNLKTLATRSISAAVFVVLLVGAVLWNYYSFTLFFFAVALLGLNEFYRLAEKLGASPHKGLGFFAAVCAYLTFINRDAFAIDFNLNKIMAGLLILCPFVSMAISMFSKKENSMKNAFFTIGGIIYSVLPFAFLNAIVFYDDGCNETQFSPWLILGLIFLIWSNDTFAYLGGSLFGKNKMIERVSPGKTWEGTLTGVLITFGLSFLFNRFVYKMDPVLWPVLGISIPVLATVGDLIESKLKREAGIKDSGNIMPGHGGILDRFDSLIFVSPFVFVLFKFF